MEAGEVSENSDKTSALGSDSPTPLENRQSPRFLRRVTTSSVGWVLFFLTVWALGVALPDWKSFTQFWWSESSPLRLGNGANSSLNTKPDSAPVATAQVPDENGSGSPAQEDSNVLPLISVAPNSPSVESVSTKSVGIGQELRVLRESWKPSLTNKTWKYIVLHHTASQRGSVESIDDTHRQRKDGAGNPWRGIGYHFVIGNGQGMTDGAVVPTFRWREQTSGAHAGVKEYNEEGIGICLIGNFAEQPPTDAQLVTVRQLVAYLKGAYKIESRNVVGHAKVKATECPGRLFPLSDVAVTPPDQ